MARWAHSSGRVPFGARSALGGYHDSMSASPKLGFFARWCAVVVLATSFSIAFAATPPPANATPAAKSVVPVTQGGTPVSFLVNGLTPAFKLLDLGDGSASDLYKKYQETRGPLFRRLNFHVDSLIGAKGGTLSGLIKWGFAIVLLAVGLSVAFGVRKGKFSILDLGWSLAKTLIGVFVFFQPG